MTETDDRDPDAPQVPQAAPLTARAAAYRWTGVQTVAGVQTVFTLTNGLIDMVWGPPLEQLRQLHAELGTIIDAANRAAAGLEVPDVAVVDMVNGGRPSRAERRHPPRERPSHFRP